jgi:hypothetical protein
MHWKLDNQTKKDGLITISSNVHTFMQILFNAISMTRSVFIRIFEFTYASLSHSLAKVRNHMVIHSKFISLVI